MVEKVGPQPVARCRVCGIVLAQTLIDQAIEYHVGCDPQVVMDQRNAELKQQLTDMILWTEANAPRTLQVAIGPSEMGNPCDQRVGRVLAGMPQVNFRMDPWPAIVGTGVHRWLESAVGTFQKHYPQASPIRKWQTEMDLIVDEMIPAHSDLYTHEADVVDYKTCGPDVFAKIRKQGPQEWQKIQGHLYGLGHENAGRPVRDVVLAFLPRAGWMKDFYLWREPYDRRIAMAAVRRVYSIGRTMVALEIDAKPHNWDQIPTTPGDHCWSCPFFADRPGEELPDALGCPGRNARSEERNQASKDAFGKGLI